ncbi:MAG: sugar phosphate isomerase/epimerase [Bacteroidales bacterium]|nr:sugar phosphate isomerase/epimerase [Bacteroidales bacterium]
MPRPILLFTGPFADLPLETLVAQVGDWGYQGVELCCWGDHLEVQRGLSDDAYPSSRLALLARHDLQVPVIANHKVGQAVSDPIDARHQSLVPDYVWGDGEPNGVRQRAAEEMTATFRLAERFGASVVSGFTGSPVWSYVTGYPAPRPGVIAEALRQFAQDWHPILDVARDCGIRFAAEVHPGQMAFDLHSAEVVLDALNGREEFGFTFDPSHFHWQGLEPVEFLRRFADRIFHVHIKDAILTLNGRSSLLAGYWPSGDPRRGWQFRSPGRGGIDWDAILRCLNEIGYDGPLSVDWHDAGMDRDFGAADAVQFLQRMDFDPPPRGPQSLRG